ncbi:protein of unknown function [Pseudomonas mediterranea]
MAYSRESVLHNLICRVKGKKFSDASQSLIHSGLRRFHLPPITVDVPVDKARATGCIPCPARAVAV